MEFLPLFLILFASVLFSTAFRRFHLPWVLALIAAGMAIGPYGFGVIEINPTIAFMGEIGLIFLMFMAGIEVRLSSFKAFQKNIVTLALLNGIVPAMAGFAIGYFFGFELIPSLLLGIIFMSSSIAVIVPSLEASGLINTKLGKTIVASTIIVDVASLVFLSVLLQTVRPLTALPLPSFYFLLTIILVAFRYGLPKIRNFFPHHRNEQDLFESEVRIILAMLIGAVVTFELLGLHPIIAAFFAGLVLSDSIRSDIIIQKLHTISYGIFIPVFFVIVGFNTDLAVFLKGGGVLGLVLAVVVASIVAKAASGWLGARLGGFHGRDAALAGFATIPQLSTTLAVVFTAVELGLLGDELATAMVILSIVTTVVAPFAIKRFATAAA